MLNRNSHVPLYIQLADLIRKQIEQGIIKPGDKLPSESEMIKSYQLGRLTVRESLSILANEGLIDKKHGKGTFCKSAEVSKKRLKVDVLLNMTDAYFMPYYLHSICEVFDATDVAVTVNDTKDSTENIVAILSKIPENGSDGVLIQPSLKVGSDSEELQEACSKLVKNGIPYIMIDNSYDNVPQSYVIVDEKRAGAIAADYLKSHGHSSVCMICRNELKDSRLRLAGFEANFGGSVYVIDYDDEFEKNIQKLLAEHPDITGCFCYNDLVARNLYRVFKKTGINIPDRISVISVDDTIIASTVSPSLTSIAHPKDLLGKEAALSLLNIISGDTAWPYTKVFEPLLIERKSCKNLKKDV